MCRYKTQETDYCKIQVSTVVNFGVKGRGGEWAGELTRVLCAGKFYNLTSVVVAQALACDVLLCSRVFCTIIKKVFSLLER